LVPNKLWWIGVDFYIACVIHDICYWMGIDKADADRMFLGNLQLIVAEQAWEIVKPVAYHYAFIYYLAVKNGGAGYYQRAGVIAMLETKVLTVPA
jgi:hypothetical protein